MRDLIGQTLDEKYKIERELGKGGMGAVYLATHVGTERAVALKVIAPEFMRRAEFVERFRREARAAGRLRHPNVVDVTDFGIAETDRGNLAYLVMEYLDGCTLGEVLEEEQRLPLSWTLDILEQTCSAVDEAHRQGIIHRDLKPDNIWLEPNPNGGYTVKVLDFGIAKLEEATEAVRNPKSEIQSPEQTARSENATLAFLSTPLAIVENATLALPNEGDATLALPANAAGDLDEGATLNFEIPGLETGDTAIFPAARQTVADARAANGGDAAGTKILGVAQTTNQIEPNAAATAALTRVGAVLGTPLYMSPEQCRGDRLDPRTDVYSLGIIAYQMLAGQTPFAGDYTKVLEAHKTIAPPPLEIRKIPRKVKKTVLAALAKNADDRPSTALDFSSKLRAHSEGFGSLLRRALTIYSEHLPTFLWLAFLFLLPQFLLTLMRIVIGFLDNYHLISHALATALTIPLGLIGFFVGIFFASILLGVTSWIVAQLLAVPLRPVDWKKAVAAARKKWRAFAGTVSITVVLAIVGYAMCGLPGIVISVLFFLVTPVVMLENLRGRAALRRSTVLARRSLATVVATYSVSFLVPIILSLSMAFFVSSIIKSGEMFKFDNSQALQIQLGDDKEEGETGTAKSPSADSQTATTAAAAEESKEAKRERKDKQETLFEAIFQILWFPVLLFLSSLSSVITGLLYLKTRQAGGESLRELLSEFEESDRTQKRWQMRLKGKLAQSGRHASRNT